MVYIEQVEGETGRVGHFKNCAHIIFRELNLDGCAAGPRRHEQQLDRQHRPFATAYFLGAVCRAFINSGDCLHQ